MGHRKNPFAVMTPDSIAADEVVTLFVDVFSDFHHIPHPGHTFVHGARGTGKTMMFRFLEPDCQMLHLNKQLSDLDFFGIYVPVKNSALQLIEFARLSHDHAELVLGEHLLSLTVASRLIFTLQKRIDLPQTSADQWIAFYQDSFIPLIQSIGAQQVTEIEKSEVADILAAMESTITRLHGDVVRYLKHLALPIEQPRYNGPLSGFLDFVVPLVASLRQIDALPHGPVYVLLDDADNLSATQARVLNSWVATRTTADISLKISTQLGYKTFRTIGNERISAPHDYSEVNISDVYTSKRSKFETRMREIVTKRLRDMATPDAFFPQDDQQEVRIQAIADQYRKAEPSETRGYHARDDANRYARPDYIRELSKKRGGRAHYRYAGFNHLVHISSGVVRHFLDAASRMFAEVEATDTQMVTHIPADVQDRVVRKLADEFLFADFEKIMMDEDEAGDIFDQLRNLIQALGTAFHKILISDASERRVFSIALSDGGERDVLDVLRLGVRYGYFHEATIGAKVGHGRVPLFILSRRLAPMFTLDPTSFAGYQFVTSQSLRTAMSNPRGFVRQLQAKRGFDEIFEDPQMALPL